eukprot:TRINITY_DN8670_c0_g1_i1.p1 TRINITY_DN8670_c0_g1~~TRINITY_DN8670_c0_g1_i1.p1  ORF type:complete len:212 (-),score=64.90 TRINITY_DN8670_c0_g1_i1:54-689(-)
MECVPHAKSRDQLGRHSEGSLFDYFTHIYGDVNSIEYQNARNNFVRSMAAYSVVSYILQIKDRHNGNMLIDDFGHIIHIDFGFIFDISPGGNIKFERAPFKLSPEMIDILGGIKSESFKWYLEYTAKAYLACRQYMDSFITLVSLMLDTKFPCFIDETIQNLKYRFQYGKSEVEAAAFFFNEVLEGALSNLSYITTFFYDAFQQWSNGVDF